MRYRLKLGHDNNDTKQCIMDRLHNLETLDECLLMNLID